MKIKLADNVHLDLVEFAVEKNNKITVCFNQYEAHCYSINDFYLSKTEITEAQWNVIRIDGLTGPNAYGRRPSILKGPAKENSDNPLLSVNWFEAFIWCGKLTEKLRNDKTISGDEVICLPTLPEWFYAFEKTEKCNKSMAKDFMEWSQDGPPVIPPSNKLKPNPYHAERTILIDRLEYDFAATPNRFPRVTSDADWDSLFRYQTKHNLRLRLQQIKAVDNRTIHDDLKFGFRVCKIKKNKTNNWRSKDS